MNKKLVKIIIVIFISTSTYLFASDKDLLWEEKTNSEIEYQNDLAGLLLKEMPEAEEIILIQRDLQIIMRKMRSEKYYYLLQNHPKQIITNQGVSQWNNFEWTEENEKALLNSNEQYTILKNEYGAIKEKNQNHPQWPLAREKFAKIRDSEEHKKIYEKSLSSYNIIEQKLKSR